jgi:dihydrolipoamide dehydrogenase
MMATGGEHLAHLLAWAIQRGETVHSLLAMPFYHPVIEEMLQSALQDIARHLESRQSPVRSA